MDFSRGTEPIQNRHVEVENHEVGTVRERKRHRFHTVSRFIKDQVLETVGKDATHALSDDVLIIGTNNAHFGRKTLLFAILPVISPKTILESIEECLVR